MAALAKEYGVKDSAVPVESGGNRTVGSQQVSG